MSLASIHEKVSLQALNTLSIPAQADYCAHCTSVGAIKESLAFAKQKRLPSMLLGEGSNTVFSKDYSGLVILNRLSGIEVTNETEESVDLRVAAGENWHKFVDFAIGKGWFGLENLALIPGLVGAAPIQNIGAYGVEVNEFISSVEYIDLDSTQLCVLNNEQCQFDYRDSVFKQALAQKVVITAVNFHLSKFANCKLGYPALNAEVGETADPRTVFNAVCKIRNNKLPNPQDIPNAGSFFKNPLLSRRKYEDLLHNNPDIVAFEHGDNIKVAAAWLIDKLGWKGKELDGVSVHAQQALVVVNPHHRSGEKVLAFAKAIQNDVKANFLIDLEIEPRLY